MATDWTATLKEQGVIANRMATEVPVALNDPNLTLDQASRLYRAIEERAQAFDQIVERMDGEDLEELLHDAAGALEDIWTCLSLATANKVRSMQGLEPIELPRDFDVD